MIVLQERRPGRRTVRVPTGGPVKETEYGFVEDAKVVEQVVEGDLTVWISDVKLRRLIQRAFQRSSGQAHAGYIRVKVENIKVLDEREIT